MQLVYYDYMTVLHVTGRPTLIFIYKSDIILGGLRGFYYSLISSIIILIRVVILVEVIVLI